MFGPSFKASKCKTQLKLCVSRIKLLRNKREMTVKQMKKEIAELLKEGKEPSATIRVEHILREEATMAAYDVVELFCELLCVRLPIIEANKECPYDLKEAIASIIFAAPRCADLPELTQIRILFTAKYGKEFAAAAAEVRPESGVNRRIIEKLSIRAPSGEVKLQMLKDIAAEHNFDWDSSNSEKILMEPKQDLLDGYHTLSTQPATDHPTHMPIPQTIPVVQATPPPSVAPTYTREESSIPTHLLPGAHDKPEETLRPPPSPDTPPYALNHVRMQDLSPVKGSPLAPVRSPSMDDEELFAPAAKSSQREEYAGVAAKSSRREEYADVAAAAAAAAESADRAAAAARAAARLAGSQGDRRTRGDRNEPRYNAEEETQEESAGKREKEAKARRELQYRAENQYKGGNYYRSESQYKGEASGKFGSGSEERFSGGESANGSEGGSGQWNAPSKPSTASKHNEVPNFSNEEQRRSMPRGGRSSSRENVFEEEAPKPKYASEDSFSRKLQEYEKHSEEENADVESEGGYDDDEDIDLPGPPSHDPTRPGSFKMARGPFDEDPDASKPKQTGSFIPAGKEGFIFFHDEHRNLKLNEVPPPDTFDAPGRSVLPPPPGHPDRSKVLKATTPKRGNSPEEAPQGEPSAFDDPFELPNAPPVEMDELTARFEALKSRN